MNKIEAVREYAAKNYFEKYGWFEVNELEDGININLNHPDSKAIEKDLDALYFS